MKTIQINNKHYQECDVIILPIKKHQATFELDNKLSQESSNYTHKNPQELYILSNGEIKEGDWYYNKRLNVILQWNEKNPSNPNKDNCKKIIATTDSSLIEGIRFNKEFPLPKIPQSFIEYFINEYNKGNVINKVLVECKYKINKSQGHFHQFREYYIYINQSNEISILIGQKKETLEEAAASYGNINYPIPYGYVGSANDFINGAKWQAEQMFSKEEVIKLLYKLEKEIKEPRSLYDNQGMDNWIKQNLK